MNEKRPTIGRISTVEPPRRRLVWLDELPVEPRLVDAWLHDHVGRNAGAEPAPGLSTSKPEAGLSSAHLAKVIGSCVGDRELYFSRSGAALVSLVVPLRGGGYVEDGEAHFSLGISSGPDSDGYSIGPISTTYVDSVLDENLSKLLHEAGIYTFLGSGEAITKQDTLDIADRAGVLAPKRWDSADYNGVSDLLSSIDVTDVVVKPYIGCAGVGVEFHSIGDNDKVIHLYERLSELAKEGCVVEERIKSAPLALEDDGGEEVLHDWNVRLVIINGMPTNWYARASSMGGPVNISISAFPISMATVRENLPTELTDKITDDKIIEFGKRVGRLYPNQVLGIDIIFDKEGQPMLIEVNSGNMNCMGEHQRNVIFTDEERQDAIDRQSVAYRNHNPTESTRNSEGREELFPDLTTYNYDIAILNLEEALKVDKVVGVMIALEITESLIDSTNNGHIHLISAGWIAGTVHSLLEENIKPERDSEYYKLLEKLTEIVNMASSNINPESIKGFSPTELLRSSYSLADPFEAAIALSEVIRDEPCHTLITDAAMHAARAFLAGETDEPISSCSVLKIGEMIEQSARSLAKGEIPELISEDDGQAHEINLATIQLDMIHYRLGAYRLASKKNYLGLLSYLSVISEKLDEYYLYDILIDIPGLADNPDNGAVALVGLTNGCIASFIELLAGGEYPVHESEDLMNKLASIVSSYLQRANTETGENNEDIDTVTRLVLRVISNNEDPSSTLDEAFQLYPELKLIYYYGRFFYQEKDIIELPDFDIEPFLQSKFLDLEIIFDKFYQERGLVTVVYE